MSDRLPPDDPWSEVLDQVANALDDAGVVARSERGALLDGVRSALDALVGVDTTSDAAPEVVVVEGGRGPEDPPTGGAAPSLRVADTPPGADAPADNVDEDATWLDEEWDDVWGAGTETSQVVVKVPAGLGTRGSVVTGRYALESGTPSHTLFMGPEPRAYRVECRVGRATVGIDGGASVALPEGCSVDLEARHITITAAGEAGAQGRYIRLGREAE